MGADLLGLSANYYAPAWFKFQLTSTYSVTHNIFAEPHPNADSWFYFKPFLPSIRPLAHISDLRLWDNGVECEDGQLVLEIEIWTPLSKQIQQHSLACSQE